MPRGRWWWSVVGGRCDLPISNGRCGRSNVKRSVVFAVSPTAHSPQPHTNRSRIRITDCFQSFRVRRRRRRRRRRPLSLSSSLWSSDERFVIEPARELADTAPPYDGGEELTMHRADHRWG